MGQEVEPLGGEGRGAVTGRPFTAPAPTVHRLVARLAPAQQQGPEQRVAEALPEEPLARRDPFEGG
jgi:hypothetical protein